ncbi:MAG TPA: GTP cyclohydrolase FolE2 [Dictyoglomaceae bacterium]|nr:GTP cyclohydrolase FolE2 [Dictyoglomaceae bacterium]HOL39881.1 GTP cyclohydrolase FolE2 [Dictyoglomaceae bacterium]HOP95275.1 GTP cyclohydrolase FolE2 [Dictyoglomaceae bacterium]HPP16295.1 GTP cyclohydrolase FolE2 [Dictyoglomaceae bacterium]HPU43268.1 GTP cyclohydrolase FolE2 [Dictyoglomaceae bacterium]
MLKDIQSEKDERNIPLKRVGIKGLEWPIKVLDQAKGYQHTVAEMSLSVDLKHDLRATHMSRFIEVLNELDILSPKALEDILLKLKKKLQAERSHINMVFPYFIWKAAPVSKSISPNKIDGIIDAELAEKLDMKIGVRVPVHTLCPCSKEISEVGAHNQRAIVEIFVKSKKMIWFETLVEISEKSASAPIYALLKRPDEKFITETAYNNPKFVEDIVRDIVLQLDSNKYIEWYRVEVTSFESIHNHEAFACVEKGG